MNLKPFFSTFEDRCYPDEERPGVIKWSATGIGWGEFYFYHENGDLYCENELMSKEFIKKMLCQMVDDAILTDT